MSFKIAEKIGRPGPGVKKVTLQSLLSKGYVDLGFKSDAPDNSVAADIFWNVQAKGWIIDNIRDAVILNFKASTQVNASGASSWGGQYNRRSSNVNTNSGGGTFTQTFSTGKTGAGTATIFLFALSLMDVLASYSDFQGGVALKTINVASQGTGNVGFTNTRHKVEGRLLILPPV